VYLKKSPKWSPYGVALSMVLTGRCFEEFYKKPGNMAKWLRSPEGVVMKPEVDWRKEYEGHCNCIQNLHRLIVLIMLFPMVGGMPRGSSRLRSYALLKMKAPKYGQRSYKWKMK
jgi:hypothetical protein